MIRKQIQPIASYFAIFDRDEDGRYNVSFPNFSGCVTFGKTFEEAREKAEELLILWLEELAAKRESIPERSERPLIDVITVPLPVGNR